MKTIKQIKKENGVIPVTYDAVFKAIFQNKKNKGILTYLISEILGINYNYVYDNLKFKNTELSKTKYQEKNKITDLLVEIEGTIINLEMNRNYQVGTVIKNNLYHHKLMYESMKKGERYENINIVIQINFNAVDMFDDRLIIDFMLRDKENKYCVDEKYINFQINMAQALKKYYNKDKLSKLEKIIAMMMLDKKEELKKISKGEKELMEFEKSIETLSEDEDIIGLYDKEAMDEFVNRINKEEAIKEGKKEGKLEGIKEGMKEGRKEGRKEGIKQGKKEGIKQGILKRNVEIAKNMLNMNMPLEVISKITGLTKEEINKLN